MAFIEKMKASPYFWEGAFLVGILLIFFAHKTINIKGEVSA